MPEPARRPVIFSPRFDRIFIWLKKKKPSLLPPLLTQMEKISVNPELGKPLRNVLSNMRRIHVANSFVLVYEITSTGIYLLDFDHHDEVYKKRR